MTNETFDAFKEGIVSRKEEPDQRLTAQASRFWSEIVLSDTSGQDANFFRHQQEADIIRKLDLSTFKKFAREVLTRGGSKHRLLVTAVSSQKNGKQDTDALLSEYPFENISDPVDFMMSLPKV
jgi:secreted Zn-dependent insulinase-like peptidase